jgi:ferredoxin-NADP reductase
VTVRPEGIDFTPGQAADISLNLDGWRDAIRPFTFTGLPHYDYLQFTIKSYPSRKGVTAMLPSLVPGNEFILHGVFGAIHYRGEGYFIAGGAGITPFISIFRYLKWKNEIGNNRLIFANKSIDDIILKDEFEQMLGKNFINILSETQAEGYAFGTITEEFLRANIPDRGKIIYVCGPPPMEDAVVKMLKNMNIDDSLIVKEAV